MRCFLICGLKRSIITIFDMRKEESKEHEMNESTTSLRYSIARRKNDFFRNSDVLVDILKTGFLYLDMLLRRSML